MSIVSREKKNSQAHLIPVIRVPRSRVHDFFPSFFDHSCGAPRNCVNLSIGKSYVMCSLPFQGAEPVECCTEATLVVVCCPYMSLAFRAATACSVLSRTSGSTPFEADASARCTPLFFSTCLDVAVDNRCRSLTCWASSRWLGPAPVDAK